ncbi:MAG: PAS domain S-box protein [Deltaproteobacteria bacterium]|nr:PAS domain S-box protein [Deltaproteobacteria bacterium]
MSDNSSKKAKAKAESKGLRTKDSRLEAIKVKYQGSREALKRSEEKYRQVVELAINVGIIITQEGRIVFVNDAFAEESGYTKEAFLEKLDPFSFIHPDDRAMVAERNLERLQGQRPPDIYEFRVYARDGRMIWIQTSNLLITWDRKPATLNFFIDITERKAAEAALKKSEEKYRSLYDASKRAEELYRSLLHASADGVAIYNLSVEIEYVNPSFTRIFGWKSDEILGRRVPKVPEPEKRAARAGIRDILERGRPVHGVETKMIAKNGHRVDVSVSGSRYDDHEGKPAGMLLTIRDISEKKRLEAQFQAAQRMEAMGTLAGGIAHDFNNLLMGVLGNVSLMLLDTEETQPNYERLKYVEQYVNSGSKLTRQLLGFARGGKYEVKPIDLNDLIEQTAVMFGRAKKEIVIHTDFEKGPLIVVVDPTQIEQVLLNLYVNAGHAMPAGGALSLETRRINLHEIDVAPHDIEPGPYVKAAFADTGVGMDEATKQRIFDPFFTTKEMARGTGLGLASAYGIIKNHGGMIHVYSEKGKGSTFSIYLPASAETPAEKRSAQDACPTGTGTILLVDDEEMIIETGRKMLESLGYETIVARSGQEAIERYREDQTRIRMVLLDMIMPEMGGGETFDRIKEIQPDAKVLLCSGYSLSQEAEAILARGCLGFMQKPFNLQQLADRLNAVLGDET